MFIIAILMIEHLFLERQGRQVVIVLHGKSLLYPHLTPSRVLKADLLSRWQRLGYLDGSLVSSICGNHCLP